MRDVFLLVSVVVGVCTSVLGLAIWLADNHTASRRLFALCFPILAAATYDWFFVEPLYSLRVQSAEGLAMIGVVFAITAAAGVLIARVRR
jgi:K+-sensing histidine kinase KdpD